MEEKKKTMFQDASPKLTFAFGIVLAVAVVSLIGLSALLVLSSQKINLTGEVAEAVKTESEQNANTFNAGEKNEIAEMKFFVMAFCPYGQQAEAGIIPMARLI